MSHCVAVAYSDQRISITRALHQYDYGQMLILNGFLYDGEFEVRFANSRDNKIIIVKGADGMVQIPDTCLESGNDIVAWVSGYTTESGEETIYTIYIPVEKREKIPKPEET